MPNTNSPVQDALLILNGSKTYTAEGLLKLSKDLKKAMAFNYARRILALAIKSNESNAAIRLEITQQWALCTYKDVDLPASKRFDIAIGILRDNIPDFENTTDQESLGIAGAIFKSKWYTDAQFKHLETSLHYYQKGYEQGVSIDNGYTAINYAFVMDTVIQALSDGKNVTGVVREQIKLLQEKSNTVKTEILAVLSTKGKRDWWLLVTIAEAYFGLQQYEEAKPILQEAMQLPGVSDWEKETTTRQLARIALFHISKDKIKGSPAWDALKVLTNKEQEDVEALMSSFGGKVGLALSGGGFRASLYHIGVLAKLAELDVLRKVEVLSCVSGGSIIGAHYYLEARNLLQTKPDSAITRQDYIDIVDRISKDFLAGVQRNLRTRIIANPFKNIRMLVDPNYSRTIRIGELYEKELFSKVNDDKKGNVHMLHELYVHPMNEDGTQNTQFKPKYENWRRGAKVPILVLNATTLNTGHNWQFTASWMGESPLAIQETDANYRLRRMYYRDEDGTVKRPMKLGNAVAASSGVPGMFEPLALSKLYENKIVRLADGGVHDNQGICGLLEQDVEVMLVSDSSGQMGTEDNPERDVLGVPLRANSILMERVRNAEYEDMSRRREAGLLKGFMFIHLKMGLDVQSINWIGCEDPNQDDPMYNPNKKITDYNINKEVQTKLAAIRTDLDSFNDTEAFALMMSGYLMTGLEFPKTITNIGETAGQPHKWNFLNLQSDMGQLMTPPKVAKLLSVAKEQTFKAWRISKPLSITGMTLLAAALIAGGIAVYTYRERSLLTVGGLGVTVFFLLLGLIVNSTIIKVVRFRETITRFFTASALLLLGFLVAFIHLNIFDKLYLKFGKRQ